MQQLEERRVLSSLVSVSPPNTHVSEGAGAVVYFSISPPQMSTVTVNYRTVPGSAIENTDYQGVTSGSATIYAFQGYVAASIPTFHDFAAEPGETFVVEIVSVSGAGIGTSSATMTIDDGWPSPPPGGTTVTWSVTASPVTEPQDGVSGLTVTATLSAALSTTLTLTYATSDSTATAGLDYTAASGSLVFAPGQTSKSFSVDIMSDWVTEPSESFVITSTPSGSTPPGVLLSPSTSQTTSVVIHDNGNWLGAAFGVSDGSDWEAEGTEVGQVPFVITLAAPAARDIQFNYWLESDSAAIDQDFNGSNGSIIIPTGQTAATIMINALNESAAEGNESFLIHVSQTNTPLDTVSAVGVIYDEDVGPPQTPTGIAAILNAQAVIEPATSNVSDAVFAHFVVTYTNPSTAAASVEWYTESPNQGDATPDQDYFAASGTLTLAPTMGSPRAVDVKVQIKYDTTTPEPDEPFSVKLRNPSGVTIAQGSDEARGTIKDRTGTVPVQYTIYAVIPQADEVGRKPAGFTIMRTGPIDQAYLVQFTIGGSATHNQDYYFANMDGTQFPSGQEDKVTIPAGSSSVSFLAVPNTDIITPEPLETIVLAIDPWQPAGNPSSATATISDAGDRVSITVKPTKTNENNSGYAIFVIERWGSASGNLLVNLSRSGTATLLDDYRLPASPPVANPSFPSSVTILDGHSLATIQVQIIDDPKIEPDETITVSLVGGTGYTIDSQQGSATLTIVDDDQVATVSITPATQNVNEGGGTYATLTVSRTGSTEFPLAAPITIGGTATKSVDYNLFYLRNGQEKPINGNGTVTFEPGEASMTLRLRPIDDSVPEPRAVGGPPEDVIITIGSSSLVQPDPNATSATVTIVDNDGPGGSFQYAYPPPLRADIYTEWKEEWTGYNQTGRVFARYKLVPNWVPSGLSASSIPQPNPYTATVSIGQSVNISQSFTIGAGGGIQVPATPPPPLTVGGTVQASLTYQYTTSTAVTIGGSYSVPANASLHAIACDLQWTAIRQEVRIVSLNQQAPPNGAAGDAFVEKESQADFWYTWAGFSWSANAVENESSAYIYIQPNAF